MILRVLQGNPTGEFCCSLSAQGLSGSGVSCTVHLFALLHDFCEPHFSTSVEDDSPADRHAQHEQSHIHYEVYMIPLIEETK